MLLPTALLLTVASLIEGTPIGSLKLGPKALNKRTITKTVTRPTPFKEPSPINVVDSVLTLTKKTSAKGYNPRSAAYLSGKIVDATTFANGSSSSLLSLEIGEEFATEITIGTQTFEVIVDTGSSDSMYILAAALRSSLG